MNFKLLFNWADRKQAILHALADRPLSGVEVGRAIGLDVAFLYVDFYQLEQEDLITSYFDEQRLEARGFNRRRFYTLTRYGRIYLSR